MNIPVDWPDTVTVSTRDLVAAMRFLDLAGFDLGDFSGVPQVAIDRAARSFDPLCEVLDVKCPGWPEPWL